MHGLEWTEDKDPTDWFMSEKLDGIRAFWNGENFFSKTGKIITAPLEFTATLPSVNLDGELWGGYGDNSQKVTSILKFSLHCVQDQKRLTEIWKEIKFCIFDVPNHTGSYPVRHSYAQNVINGCNSSIISLIPINICNGLNHLHSSLKEISNRRGLC